jgi:uncharacterized protein YkwD
MGLRVPVGPAAAARRIVWAIAVLIALAASAGAQTAPPDNLEALRQRALDLVNEARAAQGLSQLELGAALDEAAQSHARDMLRRGYFSHNSPEGRNVQDRYVAAGGSKWELVEENIARCEGCEPPVTAATIEWLQQGWMHSPEHKANILRQGLTRFGFGIASDKQQGLYAVQTFAGPGVPRGAGEISQTGTAPAALSGKEMTASALRLINEAREPADAHPLHASAALDQAAQNLLPDPKADAPTLDLDGDIFAKLPPGERDQWRALSVVAGTCGGCGAVPTAADIRFFREQWLDNPQYKRRLLDPNTTAIGFAMQANGSGRKTAVLVLGTAR